MVDISQNLISERFSKQEPHVNLTPQQREVAKEVQKNINNGTYSFVEESCCVCASNSFERIFEVDRYGIPTQNCICTDCGLIQQNPRMNDRSLTEFYDSDYRPLHDSTKRTVEDHFNLAYDYAKSVRTYLSDVLPTPIEGMKVLDVGTGAGGTMKYFEEKGHEVIGCDLGTEYIEYAQNKHELDAFVGDVSVVSEQAADVDLVLYIGVLEHLRDPVAELTRLRSIISSDTYVYNTQWGLYAHEKYQMDILRKLQIAHIYTPSLRTITNIARKSGFERVAGDESIDSVFVPTDDPEAIESDYTEAMEYLNTIERKRFLNPQFYLQHPSFKSTLDSLGVLDLAESAYEKVK